MITCFYYHNLRMMQLFYSSMSIITLLRGVAVASISWNHFKSMIYFYIPWNMKSHSIYQIFNVSFSYRRKRSHILKQTCNFHLQVWLSICVLFRRYENETLINLVNWKNSHIKIQSKIHCFLLTCKLLKLTDFAWSKASSNDSYLRQAIFLLLLKSLILVIKDYKILNPSRPVHFWKLYYIKN